MLIASNAPRGAFFDGRRVSCEDCVTAPCENSLYLVHVPKTAGTTMRQLLLEHFATKQVIDSWNNEDVFHLNPAAVAQADVVLSHSGRAFAAYILRGIDYFMLLRQPDELIISQYMQILLDSFHPLHRRATGSTAKEFLIDGGYARLFANVQTRYLFVDHPSKFEMLLDDPAVVSGRGREDKLRRFVETFDPELVCYCAMFSNLEDAYHDLCMERGFIPRSIPHLNHGVRAIPEDVEELRDCFCEFSAVDFELIDKLIGSSRSRDSIDRARMMATRRKFWETGPLPIESELFGGGWHLPEWTESGWARWSRTDPCQILVPTTARLRAITMVCWTHSLAAVANMRFSLGGEPVEASIHLNPAAKYPEFMISLDVSQIRHAPSRSILQIEGVVVRRPADSKPDDDGRWLGIYLKSMNLVF